MEEDEGRALAERVRAALLRAALEAWEDAGVQGLCAEGRWEAAVAALRRAALPSAAEDAATDDQGAGGVRQSSVTHPAP